MNKVLVVEDEKLIRQGIASMIKRSGVPVEEVIECNNGLSAMEILYQNEVDVMFTDIRMPKMNGIELVQATQKLKRVPITVAISGYDDFSYAVEMMRQGVREYILKPVERDKLKSVLQKIDEELKLQRQDKEKVDALGSQLLKYLLRDKEVTAEDTGLISKRLSDEVGTSYVVAVTHIKGSLKSPVGIILSNVLNSNVFILPENAVEEIQNTRYVGISDTYDSMDDLKKAYDEACFRRGEAFLQNMSKVDFDLPEVPEELKLYAAKMLEASLVKARVHLMGTDRLKELKKEWDSFFIAAARGQISPEDFIHSMDLFFSEYAAVYKKEVPEKIMHPLMTDCLDSYREKFMDFVLSEQQRLSSLTDSDQTEAKINRTIEFINENYACDLNMAVVSNMVSMNYSLFSTEFKKVTGTNFVNYVKGLRMNEAKRLLAQTDLKVNEISEKVGYDTKHFMKSFKSFVGVSPTEYRKNVRM